MNEFARKALELAEVCEQAYSNWMDAMVNLKPRCATSVTFEESYRAARAALVAHLEGAEQTARQAALEEAAQVCEAMHDEDRPGDYAYAIRALANEEKG